MKSVKSTLERTDEQEVLKILSEQAPVGVCVIQDGKFCCVNSYFSVVTGYGADQLIGKDSFMLVVPEDREKVSENDIKMLKGKLHSPYQFRVICKDGTVIWVMATVKSIQYHGRRATLGNYMEITDRKQVEDAVRRSEGNYRVLSEQAPVVGWLGKAGEFVVSVMQRVYDWMPSTLWPWIVTNIPRVCGFSGSVSNWLSTAAWPWITGVMIPKTKEIVNVVYHWIVQHLQEIKDEIIEIKDWWESTAWPWISGLSPYQFRVTCKDGSIIWIVATVKSTQYHGRRAFLGNYMEVTERQRMEEALEESEEQYSKLANSITDVFFAMDEHLRYTYWNKASEILTGIRAEDAIGKPLRQVFPDTAGTRNAEKVYRNVLKRQQSQTFVNDYDNSGRHYVFEISAYPTRGGISVFVKDITERKQMDDVLRQSEEKYRILSEEAPVGVCVVQDGKFCYFNSNFPLAVGYAADELIVKDPLDLIVPEDREMVRENEIKMLKGELTTPYQFRVIHRDGSVKWVMEAVRSVQYRGRRAVLGNYMEVTERKQMEDRLKESEEKYRTILEEMDDGYFETDLAGNLTFVNDAMIRFLGYSRQELIGMNFRGLRPKEEAKVVFEAYNRMYKTGKPLRNLPTEVVCKDGRHAFAETSAFPIGNDKGQITGFRGIRRDITERKQAEKRLTESEQKYRLLFETSLDYITQLDADGRYLAVNPAAARSLGIPVEELIGKTVFQVMPQEVAQLRFENMRRVLEQERPQVFEDERAGRHFQHIVIPTKTSDQREAVQVITRDITEPRKMEEALRQSEETHKALFDNSVIGMFVLDAETMRMAMCNQAAAKMFGFNSTQEAIGANPVDFIAPEERDRDLNIIMNEMFEQDLRQTHEFQAVNKDGRKGWISVTGARIVHEGKLAGLVSITNINRRKRAEEALKQSEEKYRTILEEMEDSYFEVDLAGNLTFVNNSVCRDLGYSRDELIGMSYKGYTAKDNVESLFRAFNEVYRTGMANKGFAWKTTRKDGSHGFAETSISLLHNARGEITGFRGVGRDVTERKQMEERLRQSEENYRTLFNNSVVGMYVLDVETFKVVMGNRAAAEMAGFASPGEGIGINPLDFVVPEDRAQVLEVAVKEFEQDLRRTHEVRVITKDGGTGWISISSAKIMHGGKPAALVTIDNITQRKRMEEALRQSEENYRALFDSSVIGTFVLDAETMKIVIGNQAAARMFGLSSAQESIGKNPLDFVLPEDKERAAGIIAKELFEQDLRKTHEIQALTKDGRKVWVSITGARITHGGNLAGLISFTDVTEQKKQTEKLVMTDRLASLGELASGTAHELNNPLTSIIGFSQLLMERKVPEDIREDLRLINSEAQRAVNVTQNLLTFARKHASVKQRNQINSIIEDVLELRAYDQGVNGIEVEKRLDQNLPEIMVDYFQMQQVFMNIIINAEYFMIKAHNRGTLTITSKKENDVVMISIADDGPGIPPENLKRIFDPFFTTKETGKGTGLGLSICHGIVTEHEGQIYVKSQLGRGATFFVELPISGRRRYEDIL